MSVRIALLALLVSKEFLKLTVLIVRLPTQSSSESMIDARNSN
jgi:hypothetical protein